ncbi:MAG: hypothetical protein Q8K45_16475, partial [Rubrivivax sp.]|nr:hypothetical protein [Rubrivivax sp.]
SRIVSERNVWETPAALPTSRLLRVFKGEAFADRGSLHNGLVVDLLAAARTTPAGAALGAHPGWQPRHHGPIDDAAEVAVRVRAGAGAGRLWTGQE